MTTFRPLSPNRGHPYSFWEQTYIIPYAYWIFTNGNENTFCRGTAVWCHKELTFTRFMSIYCPCVKGHKCRMTSYNKSRNRQFSSCSYHECQTNTNLHQIEGLSNLASILGQIGPKWNKSDFFLNFVRSFILLFGSSSQNVLKLILSSPRCVPFEANLTQFGYNPNMPVVVMLLWQAETCDSDKVSYHLTVTRCHVINI